MTDYQRLVDFFMDEIPEGSPFEGKIKYLVEKLLEEGVTFATDNNVGSKWIPASEPPKEWKDENGDAINYLIYSPEYGVEIGNWIECAKVWFWMGMPFKVTHWMPLPERPDKE